MTCGNQSKKNPLITVFWYRDELSEVGRGRDHQYCISLKTEFHQYVQFSSVLRYTGVATVFESFVWKGYRGQTLPRSLWRSVWMTMPRSRVSMHECFSLVQGTYYPLH